MSDWRYFATRLDGRGGETPIAWDLPLSDVSITNTLSGPDAIDATITPEIPRLIADDGRVMLEPWSTAIYAEAAGVIRAGCLLMPDSQMDGESYALSAAGFASYPSGQRYDGSRSRVQTDPLNEVRHIWAHLQGHDGGDLGLVLDETTSDVRIGEKKKDVSFTTDSGRDVSFEAGPYTLNWWTTDDLGREIEDLAADTPFDFREAHRWRGEEIEHRLRLGYPRLGRRRDNLRFVLGENLTAVPSVDYADDYASEVMVLGAGEGRNMAHAVDHRPDARLRRAVTVADKSLRSNRACRRRAEREVAERIGDDEISEVTVRDHPNAPIDAWDVGDDIQVTLPSSTGWAGGVSLWCRVTEATIAPADGQAATLRLVRSDREEG